MVFLKQRSENAFVSSFNYRQDWSLLLLPRQYQVLVDDLSRRGNIDLIEINSDFVYLIVHIDNQSLARVTFGFSRC